MEHLTLKNFLSIIGNTEEDKISNYNYKRMYNKIIEKWAEPEDWFESDNKTIRVANYVSNSYWFAWSMAYEVSLPVTFIISVRATSNSLNILKSTLEDWGVLEKSLNKMKSYWAEDTINSSISKMLLLCVYLGKNEVSKISLDDVNQAAREGVLKNNKYTGRITNLIKVINGNDDEEFIAHKQNQIRIYKRKNNSLWSPTMSENIEKGIKEICNKSINYKKLSRDKKSAINFFGEWYADYKKIDSIDDLIGLNRECWLKYIEYLERLKIIGNKSKHHKALGIKDFLEWAKIKNPDIISSGEIIRKNDFKKFKYNKKKKTLAFDSRDYAEKILNFVIHEYSPASLLDKYYRELIIIAANSGARISELRDLEYGSVYYSQEEELYKTRIKHIDKLGQVNRPLYFTVDGYEAIKRVEKLRIDTGELIAREDPRTKRKYIRLFEYNYSSGFLKTSLYTYLDKIKRMLNLVDKDGKPVSGGMHGFRHHFGMIVFIESNYNISALRYLLGHKSYTMTYKYLEEDKMKIINEIRNSKYNNDMKIAGKGLDTVVDIIMDNAKGYEKISGLFDSNTFLSDIIRKKLIVKKSFGYCLNPDCDRGCYFGCKNFLITNEDEDKLIKSAIELFEFLCFSISTFDNIEDSFENLGIQKQIENFIILIGELKILDIDFNKLPNDVRELLEAYEYEKQINK